MQVTTALSMGDEYSVYVPESDDAQPFPIEPDDATQIDLIAETDLEHLRARLWYFQPGDSVSFHYHDEQEELYYVVKGTGKVVVGEDREHIEVPEGGLFRPETTVPRHLRNDTDNEVIWLIVGAPPSLETQIWDKYDDEGLPTEDGEFTPLEDWL
jgi:quercetin dioxygenase-like cupin family protein